MRKRYVLLVLTAVVLTGLLAWSTRRMNARVISEIQLHSSSERALETMVMTLAGGTVYPVNYRWEGDSVFVGIDVPGLEAAVAVVNRNQIPCSRTADAKEGMRAFIEKRPPVYQGR